ncbi:uncharacterized protein LOC131237367 [Magnolia sinica]|uniref:uncharacterized protein LOC131237367 n=1 Tax=Magnolia sinica TaxID=86752 RepID=UPI002658D704|nr:uncharacterized protein LOC131237367 [Magnolia sinica]
MEGCRRRRGYAWAISAGLNAALAAVSAKLFSSQENCKCIVAIEGSLRFRRPISLPVLKPLVKYGLVIFFNVSMWGCYVNSLKALPSLQATVTNFATNFLSSGLAGFFLFKEPLSSQWFGGALLIVLGVFVLSKSSIDRKVRSE